MCSFHFRRSNGILVNNNNPHNYFVKFYFSKRQKDLHKTNIIPVDISILDADGVAKPNSFVQKKKGPSK